MTAKKVRAPKRKRDECRGCRLTRICRTYKDVSYRTNPPRPFEVELCDSCADTAAVYELMHDSAGIGQLLLKVNSKLDLLMGRKP